MMSDELKRYLADKYQCEVGDVVEDLLVADVVHAGDVFAGFVDELEREYQTPTENG